MDYDPNEQQSWAFTFIGGTSDLETEASESTVEQVFPLTSTKVGDRVWIVGFSGEGGINRLLSLGLIPGAEVEVMSCMSKGSILVKFQNHRLGLGAGMANRVMVTDNPVLNNKRKNSK